MREIDTNLFIQIIEDAGCIPVWHDYLDGDIIISHYLSQNGNKKVPILCSEETIDELTGKNYLHCLELTQLIDAVHFQ